MLSFLAMTTTISKSVQNRCVRAFVSDVCAFVLDVHAFVSVSEVSAGGFSSGPGSTS